jgi:hypothetical protein
MVTWNERLSTYPSVKSQMSYGISWILCIKFTHHLSQWLNINVRVLSDATTYSLVDLSLRDYMASYPKGNHIDSHLSHVVLLFVCQNNYPLHKNRIVVFYHNKNFQFLAVIFISNHNKLSFISVDGIWWEKTHTELTWQVWKGGM